jgi:hypothetical protein
LVGSHGARSGRMDCAANVTWVTTPADNLARLPELRSGVRRGRCELLLMCRRHAERSSDPDREPEPVPRDRNSWWPAICAGCSTWPSRSSPCPTRSRSRVCGRWSSREEARPAMGPARARLVRPVLGGTPAPVHREFFGTDGAFRVGPPKRRTPGSTSCPTGWSRRSTAPSSCGLPRRPHRRALRPAKVRAIPGKSAQHEACG